MTTIAIDGKAGVVAFDTRITSGNEIVYGVAKAWVSKRHPVIYAGAGGVATFHAIANHIEFSDKLPWETNEWWSSDGMPKGSDAYLAIMNREGKIWMYEHPHWYPVDDHIVTLGSGSQAARAAMLLGYPAAEAVEVACMVDSGSGLPVNVLSVDDIPVRRRRRK